MHSLTWLIFLISVYMNGFRGSAASLRPSAGGDSERPLCQPGDQPRHGSLQEQTSYYYRQDKSSQCGGKVKLTF